MSAIQKARPQSPRAIFKFAARAVLEKLTTPSVADLIIDVGWPIAQDFYNSIWSRKSVAEQIDEIESSAQADPSLIDLDEIIDTELAESGKTITAQQRKEAKQYLTLVPAAVRRTLKRPDDPSGKTVTNELLPKSPEALVQLLPPKLPRFKSGDPVSNSTYVLDDLLGVGGYGEVWRAVLPDMQSAAPVAIKFCLDPSAIVSLKREKQLLDKLQSIKPHDGIVRLQNLNLNGPIPWLQYEYVEGGTLAGLIHELYADPNRPPPVDFINDLFFQIVEPIQYAHQHGIIHRDLKPANILVTGSKSNLKFKITDFGIGGLASEQARQQTMHGSTRAHTQHQTLSGSYTPFYASPQQMRGARPDVRDDVYSLGIIWMQMLTGDVSKTRLGRRDRERIGSSITSMIDELAEHEVGDRPKKIDLPRRASSVSTASILRQPQSGDVTTNSIGMKLAYIPAGTFTMGSPEDEQGRSADEMQHDVTISRPFLMATTPVTQKQWIDVMGTTLRQQRDKINKDWGIFGEGDEFPMYFVN